MKKLLNSYNKLFSITSVIMIVGFISQQSIAQVPILGIYSNTSTVAGTNTTINPGTPPLNTISAAAYTNTNFTGTLSVDPLTGSLRVTDAKQAGTFLVTVKAFGNGGTSTTTTFDLTITNPLQGQDFYLNNPNVSVGTSPDFVVVGDFNNDGKQDLAVANYNSISIRMGDGNGNFTGTTTLTGLAPSSIAIGDFNGDGNQDLAIDNNTNNTISVRLGDGNGNFSGSTDVPVGSMPVFVATGDFNSDGKQDLAAVDQTNDSISIRLGDGNGGFSGTTELATGSGIPSYLAIGDFNQDGNQDLAVSKQNSNTESVAIYYGDGLGDFVGTIEVPANSDDWSIAIGDFNQDGIQDLACVNNSAVSIRLGDGAGDFYGNTDVYPGGYSVAIGDFNGDGHQDLVIGTASGISVRYGDGMGNFYGNMDISFIGIPLTLSMAVGDFNNDGLQDIVATNHYTNDLSILLGTLNAGPSLGNYANTTIVAGANLSITPDATPANTMSTVAYTNTNFTGTLAVDPATGILTVTDAKQAGTYNIIVKAFGTGGLTATKTFTLTVTNPICSQGLFLNPSLNSVGTEPYSIASGDFNNDGNQDLAVANSASHNISIELGNGLGSFNLNTNVSVGMSPNSIAVGDFNGDGKQDIVTTNGYNSITVCLGNGSGGFTGLISVPVGNFPRSIALGDFNEDGIQDFVTANEDGNSISIRLGDGSGNFTGSTEVPVGGNPYFVVVGNFNFDGHQDIAVANSSSGTVSICLGDGTGGFISAADVIVGNTPVCLALGDFNNDGNQDIATASFGDMTASIRLGNGIGGFTGTTEVPLGPSSYTIAVGDFNGDGNQDLITAGGNLGAVRILGDGSGGFGGNSLISVGDDPVSIAIGDFNNDGRFDLAVANFAFNDFQIVLGALPVDPTIPSLSSTSYNICASQNTTLSIANGMLNSAADWHWYSNTCGGIHVGIGSSIIVSPSATTTYYARGEGGCATPGNCGSVMIQVTSMPPAGSIHFTGLVTDGCVNAAPTSFSVNAVNNASLYHWSSNQEGVRFNGNPGPFETSVPTVNVSFVSLPAAGTSGWSICVFGANACGNTNSVCTWVRATVSKPTPISGTVIGCPGSSGNLYSVATVNGAASYQWSATGGIVIAGNGSQNITVAFPPGFVSGILKVHGQTSCGYNGPNATLTIKAVPAVPGAISGSNYPCPNASTSYSVAAVPGAASYTWTTSVPGAVVTGNTNTCSIFFPTTIPNGSSISVVASSGCPSFSPVRSKGIATGLPGVPAVITGPASGQCGQTGVSYSITPLARATGYNWSASCGTIVGPINLHDVTVNWPASFVTCTLSVSATNSCGTGVARILGVAGAPSAPGVISGNATPCANTTEFYSTIGSSGATSYIWTIPAGTTIQGSTTGTSIQVQWGSTSGNITVRGSNGCGNSGLRTMPCVISCRMSQVQSSTDLLKAEVYPNPASNKATVKFTSAAAANYHLCVADMLGQTVLALEGTSTEGINMIELNLGSVAKGIYQLSIMSNGNTEQIRVVVQ